MRRPIFLDRDGVINARIPGYVSSLAELALLPRSIEAMARLDGAGYDLFVISNQQGVGLGVLTLDDLGEITEAIQSKLREHGCEIRKFYYCPSLKSENDPMRKPGSGMFLAARDEFGLELGGAFMIGDSPSDVEAALAAGCRPLVVLSGITQAASEIEGWKAKPERVFEDLFEAADWILAQA